MKSYEALRDVLRHLYRSRLNFSMSVLLVKEGIQLFNRKISNRTGTVDFYCIFFVDHENRFIPIRFEFFGFFFSIRTEIFRPDGYKLLCS